MNGNEADPRPRNWLVPVILVSLRERDSHGYELMERTTEFGFEATNPGTLYKTLRRMEEGGSVESSWEAPRGGPARRTYKITAAGEASLDSWAEALGKYQRTVDAFFLLCTGRRLRPQGREQGGEQRKSPPTPSARRAAGTTP